MAMGCVVTSTPPLPPSPLPPLLTFAPGACALISSRAANAFSGFLQAMVTSAPSWASRTAVSFPNPVFPPVMTAVCGCVWFRSKKRVDDFFSRIRWTYYVGVYKTKTSLTKDTLDSGFVKLGASSYILHTIRRDKERRWKHEQRENLEVPSVFSRSQQDRIKSHTLLVRT